MATGRDLSSAVLSAGGRGLGRHGRGGATDWNDHRDLPADQVGCQRRQAIIMTFRPAIFEPYILAFVGARIPPLAPTLGMASGMRSRPRGRARYVGFTRKRSLTP
jgi:hypothetical protein